ncbi:hypothetical protein [Methylorubrum extorquens]|uniref:Uncharacterized protein n=1 Tax=Methylorubrum extorquens TaxID=408 RepID=A0AAX3WIJ1_METEX|nr:hypothetical protein [Methylorubrum extorquens]WHQ70490.1 hypothetical protein KEC54_02260 [Methylorubrum extorquens]
MDKSDLERLRIDTANAYGINLHQRYTEREAASLLIVPSRRLERKADISTIKRKRCSEKIPFVQCGDGSVAYLGMMLCDFLMFGERSVLLWGAGDVSSN